MAGFAEVLRQAGVLGAGGAGFPTYRKLSAKAEVVIANGAECEPMLHKDQALMAGRAAEVIDGLRRAMAAVGAAKGYLAVKEKHGAAIEALRRVSAGDAGIELHPLPDIYPAGDEVILIYETTARVVPPGALPGTVGVLVDNVETL
ncbi:MAG: electron transport complex protein RnfC, partial [Bacteroidota bacterium]